MLTYEERTTLAIQASNAAIGQVVVLQPALFQKLMALAYQAESQNAGPVSIYFKESP